jgi:hypothetical protein
VIIYDAWIRCTLLALLMNSLALSAASDSHTWTAWVSDEACGALHTKPGGADCIRKCHRGGASVGHPEWKPQRLVLVNDADQSVWIALNPEKLQGFEGLHVTVTASIDAGRKGVRIERVTETTP